MDRVTIALALAAAQMISVSGGASRQAGVASAPAASAPCSAYAGRVEKLDDAGTRYAIALFTHGGTHAVAGALALYQGDDRYDVRFADATAADPRDRAATPTPVVVRFASPVNVDAAVVTALGANACAPPDEPWRANAAVTQRIGTTQVGNRAHVPFDWDAGNPDDALWSRFRAAAATAAELVPGPVVHEPQAVCARPRTGPLTAYVASGYGVLDPALVMRGVGGQAVVLLTLDDRNRLTAARIERSSAVPEVDRAALAIVQASQFRSPLFRCRAYGGSYLFFADLR